MGPFSNYFNQNTSFWSYVSFVSENLRYSKKGGDEIAVYSNNEIKEVLSANRIYFDEPLVETIRQYTNERADLLNNFAKSNLMNVESAENLYKTLSDERNKNIFLSKEPLNKQKGEKKKVAFFTAIINILTEKTIRETTNNFSNNKVFEDDPRSLTYFQCDTGKIIGSTSRRLDGCYPSLVNPLAIWEIKEYYYTTTFGSRIADGVYETELDGYEFKNIQRIYNKKFYHILFIDGYETWWEQGKSYLCRIVDILNKNLVDEVIVGKEVLTRWPQILTSLIK